LNVPQPLRETPKGDPSPILSPLSPFPVFEPLSFELGREQRETAGPELDGDELEQEESAEFHDIPEKDSWACVTQYTPPHSARRNSNEDGCGDAPQARRGGDRSSQISHTRKAWQQRRQRAAVQGGEDEAQRSIEAHDSRSTNPRNESTCRASEVTVVADVVARRKSLEDGVAFAQVTAKFEKRQLADDEDNAVEPCIDALFPFPEQQADATGQPIWQVLCQRLPAIARSCTLSHIRSRAIVTRVYACTHTHEQVYDVVTDKHLSLHGTAIDMTFATSPTFPDHVTRTLYVRACGRVRALVHM
jgi:hypothetical protein